MIVTLAGCGHSSQNNQSTNKSALSAKMQNDNSESSSSQSQPAQPKVNLGKYQYQVPKETSQQELRQERQSNESASI